MVIIAITCQQDHPKVPVIEQQQSTAAGVGYLLLALQARGFGGMWRTGAMAYHPSIYRQLELGPQETIAGFIYVGTPRSERGQPARPRVEDHVQYWGAAPGEVSSGLP